jgi:hypothetical protein
MGQGYGSFQAQPDYGMGQYPSLTVRGRGRMAAAATGSQFASRQLLFRSSLRRFRQLALVR